MSVAIHNFGNDTIAVDPPPPDLRTEYDVIFSREALQFVAELVSTFDKPVDELIWNRIQRKSKSILHKTLPQFRESPARDDKTWKVGPVPLRAENRKLDLGDVSPSNTSHFVKALKSKVQGIQVDFDDGHCPSWRNQIVGLYNVYQAVHGRFNGVEEVEEMPVLMLRPRAWNMIDHNVMVNGKKCPGSLVDFSLLMFHNATTLAAAESGPFFYISKIEVAEEAMLWNEIFTWSQAKLNLPYGTIKACVLIENILASFELEEILYALKDHSLGLNTGIWDYSASIISKFGDSRDFLLPDRNKYVSMDRHFLLKYMQLVVQTCHGRGAHATGGMAASLIAHEERKKMIKSVVEKKVLEIETGVDGFMVYDFDLVPIMNQLWTDMCGDALNQISLPLTLYEVKVQDLLRIPEGGVTYVGLKHNISVAILFIFNWLNGNGTFIFKGAVEDSATAEISRSQVWQWLRHKTTIEDSGMLIDIELIQRLTVEFVKNIKPTPRLILACNIFMDIVTSRFFPDYITTYLNDSVVFRQSQLTVPKIKTKL